MVDPSQKRVLLLGAGLMSEPVIDYLLKRKENIITVANNILKDAERICSVRERCTPKPLDVNDEGALKALVKDADIVISYVPAFLHPKIAAVCLGESKNMITASYISKDLAALNEQVIDKGLTFLNEIGFDPGIDHLSTMKILDEVKSHGGKIIDYESYGSGLPAPDCCDNPFGYKFSWSPIGALRALKNDAKFLRNGQIELISAADLLYTSFPKEVNMSLNLEGYPNRDSTQYVELYGLKDAKNVMRGTLRYQGFSLLARSLIELGLFSEDPIAKDVLKDNWRDLLVAFLSSENKKIERLDESGFKRVLESSSLQPEDSDLVAQILNKVLRNHNYKDTPQEQLTEYSVKIIKAFKWLGFFSTNTKVEEHKTTIETLCALMQTKMSLPAGEKDLIIMFHRFKIEWPNGKTEVRRSSLIKIGEKTRSAMSCVVGVPTAIATQLVLDGKITKKGVLMPNTQDIYDPILELLAKEGIICREETE